MAMTSHYIDITLLPDPEFSHAHLLGAKDPLMHRLAPALIDLMGGHYTELREAQGLIRETLRAEEERFKTTLDRGLKLLDAEIEGLDEGAPLPGDTAFKLYDTFGFPVDLTADIARENGMVVDMSGFDRAMHEQKERARSASNFSSANQEGLSLDLTTEFLGYEELSCRAKIIGLLHKGLSTEEVSGEGPFSIILDKTTFYAEAGGQIGDIGEIIGLSSSFKVSGTTSISRAYLHEGTLSEGFMRVGDDVSVKVNPEIREAIRINHSATHLLHAALRKVLGEHVKQRGSRVSAETLRFDFSHFELQFLGQIRRDLITIRNKSLKTLQLWCTSGRLWAKLWKMRA